MGLPANAVELVFHEKIVGHGPLNVGQIRRRRRQHELERMEKAHLDLMKPACARAHGCFANVVALVKTRASRSVFAFFPRVELNRDNNDSVSASARLGSLFGLASQNISKATSP